MRINIDFAQYVAVIRKYQEAFEAWYYELDGHTYKQRSDLPYKAFDVTPVIDWMKEVAPESNARVIEKFVEYNKRDKSLPSMYF